MNKKEVKMYMENKEFEKFCKEADSCNLSHSNYMRVMLIFGKMFVGRGKLPTSQNISERISGLSTFCSIFKSPIIEESELNFLTKQKLKENKK